MNLPFTTTLLNICHWQKIFDCRFYFIYFMMYVLNSNSDINKSKKETDIIIVSDPMKPLLSRQKKPKISNKYNKITTIHVILQ